MATVAKEQYQVEVDVKPSRAESARVENAPFDQGKKALEAKGYDIISLHVNAQLRIQQGKDAYISQNGNRVREGPIYIPGKGNYLARKSPILDASEQATQSHREGNEFYIDDEAVQKALEDSVELPNKSTNISTKIFNEIPFTVWAFGGEQQAQEYGDFLQNSGITEMPIWVVDSDYVSKQDSPFARQLWFGGLVNWSGLNGYGRDLRHGGVRGVKHNAEGVVQKNYGEDYIEKHEETVKRVMGGELGTSSLEELAVFLNRLKS